MIKSLFRKLKKVPDYIIFLLTVRGGFSMLFMVRYKSLWGVMRPLASLYRRTIIARTRVIAVTGSLGKTTTTQVIRQVMLKKPRKEAYGNFGCSLAENIFRCRPWDKHLVIETAISGPGQMTKFSEMIRPDITVVTSIKSDHYKSFQTLEATRLEKSKLVKVLSPKGVAILNGDDPNVRWMAAQTQAKVIYFGMNDDNDIRATDIELDWPRGTRFKLHADNEERIISVKLIGQHMVYPVLAAVAVGLTEGKPLDEIIDQLPFVKAASGRMEVIPLENGAILIDDSYKGTLESYFEAFETLARIPAKRRILVIGSVEQPPGKQGPIYNDLGERASRCADLIIYCGGVFQRFRSGAVNAGMDREKIIYVSSRIPPAIEWLKENLKEGDVVLTKSTSSRRFQRITLALKGQPVSCSLKDCRIKVLHCHLCSLVNRPEKIFKNAAIVGDLDF